MATDMKKALRQAALLRNRIETCLIASPGPMTGRELADYAGVKEIVGDSLSGYNKLSTQLKNMFHRGELEKLGRGTSTSYRWLGQAKIVPEAQPTTMSDLQIKVDKSKHTIAFVFNGISITIEVL